MLKAVCVGVGFGAVLFAPTQVAGMKRRLMRGHLHYDYTDYTYHSDGSGAPWKLPANETPISFLREQIGKKCGIWKVREEKRKSVITTLADDERLCSLLDKTEYIKALARIFEVKESQVLALIQEETKSRIDDRIDDLDTSISVGPPAQSPVDLLQAADHIVLPSTKERGFLVGVDADSDGLPVEEAMLETSPHASKSTPTTDETQIQIEDTTAEGSEAVVNDLAASSMDENHDFEGMSSPERVKDAPTQIVAQASTMDGNLDNSSGTPVMNEAQVTSPDLAMDDGDRYEDNDNGIVPVHKLEDNCADSDDDSDEPSNTFVLPKVTLCMYDGEYCYMKGAQKLRVNDALQESVLVPGEYEHIYEHYPDGYQNCNKFDGSTVPCKVISYGTGGHWGLIEVHPVYVQSEKCRCHKKSPAVTKSQGMQWCVACWKETWEDLIQSQDVSMKYNRFFQTATGKCALANWQNKNEAAQDLMEECKKCNYKSPYVNQKADRNVCMTCYVGLTAKDQTKYGLDNFVLCGYQKYLVNGARLLSMIKSEAQYRPRQSKKKLSRKNQMIRKFLLSNVRSRRKSVKKVLALKRAGTELIRGEKGREEAEEELNSALGLKKKGTMALKRTKSMV